MSTLNIFAYKGSVGAISDINNGTFINNPLDDSQLGVVVSVEHCTISEEAKSILSKSTREGGSFAPFMLTEHADGGASVAVMGIGCHLIEPVVGSTCSLSVLDRIPVVPNDPPADFVSFIDD